MLKRNIKAKHATSVLFHRPPMRASTAAMRIQAAATMCRTSSCRWIPISKRQAVVPVPENSVLKKKSQEQKRFCRFCLRCVYASPCYTYASCAYTATLLHTTCRGSINICSWTSPRGRRKAVGGKQLQI